MIQASPTMLLFIAPNTAGVAWAQPDTIPKQLQHPLWMQTSNVIARGADTVFITYGNGIGISIDGGRTFEIRDTGVGGGKDICLTRQGPLWRFDSTGRVEISMTGGLSWSATQSPQIDLKEAGDGVSSDGRRFWYQTADGKNLITSADEGTSWDTLTLGYPYSRIFWADADRGVHYIPEQALCITNDGGRTWDTVVTKHSQQSPVIENGTLDAYPVPEVITVNGGEGTLDISIDTGHTWKFIKLLNLSNLNILWDSLWYATGLSSPPVNATALYRSTNRGTSWNQINYTCPNGPGPLSFGDSLHGTTLGTAQSSDGGYTWDCLDTSAYAMGPPNIYPSGFDASSYYGLAQRFGIKYICLSTDRGSTWSALFPAPSTSFLPMGRRLFFSFSDKAIWTNNFGERFDTLRFDYSGSLAGFIKRAPDGTLWAGDDLELYVSTDTGNSWVNESQNIPYVHDSGQLTYSFLPVDRETGFLKTSSGNVLRTVNAGRSWQQDSIFPKLIMDSRHWYDGRYTSDAGATWNVIAPPPGNGGLFLAVDSMRWLSSGYYTTNAGATWSLIPGFFSAKGISFTVVDSSTAFGGQLWRLDLPWYVKPQQDVTSSVPEIPLEVSASPNPMGESAVLSFTMRNTRQVTVEVSDVLGNKVTTVFSGLLAAGNQSVPISLAGFPAGVYFATIAIGDKDPSAARKDASSTQVKLVKK